MKSPQNVGGREYSRPPYFDGQSRRTLKMKVSVISRCSTRFVHSQRFYGPSKKGIGSRVDTTSENAIWVVFTSPWNAQMTPNSSISQCSSIWEQGFEPKTTTFQNFQLWKLFEHTVRWTNQFVWDSTRKIVGPHHGAPQKINFEGDRMRGHPWRSPGPWSFSPFFFWQKKKDIWDNTDLHF